MGPAPFHPAKLEERQRFAPLLAGRFTEAKRIQEGKSQAFRLTLPMTGGVEDTFFAVQKERGVGVNWEVNAVRREAVASLLDLVTGLGMVPTTTRLFSGDKEMSRQLFWRYPEDDYRPQSYDSWLARKMPYPISRMDAEKLRGFDYIVGNRDRHGGNLLLDRHADPNQESYRLVAIDNGLILPHGPLEDFRWPKQGFEDHVEGGVLESTQAYLKGIDLELFAGVLARADIGQEPTRHAVRRLARLKESPDILLPQRWSRRGAKKERGWKTLRRWAASETQRLGKKKVAELDDLVASAYRSSGAAAQPTFAALQEMNALYY